MASFNWVAARSGCALEHVFQILSEIVDSDVKAANALGRRGVKFKVNTEAGGKTIVVRDRDMSGVRDLSIVVIELTASQIKVSQRVANRADEPMFAATPTLNEDLECQLEIDGKTYKLWQVSQKALEGLFFEF